MIVVELYTKETIFKVLVLTPPSLLNLKQYYVLTRVTTMQIAKRKVPTWDELTNTMEIEVRILTSFCRHMIPIFLEYDCAKC